MAGAGETVQTRGAGGIGGRIAGDELGDPGAETAEKAGVIRMRRIWSGETRRLCPGGVRLSWREAGGYGGEGDGGYSRREGEPGTLAPAGQPGFPAVRVEGAAASVPQPMEG